jgi:MinD superfamily P-loop ATPase
LRVLTSVKIVCGKCGKVYDGERVVVYDNARMIHSRFNTPCHGCGECHSLAEFKYPTKARGRIVSQTRKEQRRLNKLFTAHEGVWAMNNKQPPTYIEA